MATARPTVAQTQLSKASELRAAKGLVLLLLLLLWLLMLNSNTCKLPPAALQNSEQSWRRLRQLPRQRRSEMAEHLLNIQGADGMFAAK